MAFIRTRFSDRQIADMVMMLIGEIEPIGETAAKTPYECMHRLENQYVMTSLGGDRFADVSMFDGQITCPNCGEVLGYA